MKKFQIPLYLLTALIVFICLCTSDKKQSIKKVNIPFVEGFIVKPVTITQAISVSGTIKPFEETILMPDVSGRVVTLNVPEGKFVRQRTVLVKLFDDDLQAGLKKCLAQLALAEQTEKRNAELLKVNGISRADYDQSALQIHSTNADIEILRAQIRKTEILSPFDGVLGLRNVSMGAQVTPGTALATIRSIKRLKIDFSVPEKYSRLVKAGLKVKLSMQGEDTTFDATVIATEEAVDASTRNLKARATIDNETAALKPGTFTTVDLELGENANALMIPTQAIIPQERNKQVIVARGGKAKFTPVKTGVRQESSIEVVTGLTIGDTIVTTGILFLKPGADLKISKITQ